jgi:hypothetical protein
VVEKPEGKRPYGRPRCIWEDNVTMDLREVGWESVDWIHLGQDGSAAGTFRLCKRRGIPWRAEQLLAAGY